MIMREPVPCRLAAGAKLFLVLLLLAALPAWTLGQERTEPQNERKTVEKKDLNIELLQDGDLDIEFVQIDANADAAKKVKDLEAKIAELNKQLQALKAARTTAGQKTTLPLHVEFRNAADERNLRVITVGPDGKLIMKDATPQAPHVIQKQQYKVIGPDGKEIKDAKVIIVEPSSATQRPAPAPRRVISEDVNVERAVQAQLRLAEAAVQDAGRRAIALNLASGSAGHVINLSRATYTLPKDKAQALAAFLKENVKASVLELKLEEQGLTVTTTPETQAAIGGIAKLMAQGQVRGFEIRLKKLGVERDNK